MPFTHHHTGIRQWERNESIHIKFWGKQLNEKNKELNKSDGVHIGVQKHANCFDQVFLGTNFLPHQLR